PEPGVCARVIQIHREVLSQLTGAHRARYRCAHAAAAMLTKPALPAEERSRNFGAKTSAASIGSGDKSINIKYLKKFGHM
ncbi:MAG: hypothetical protein VXZ69_03880, partial [Pseudomonadota bacterium]|nr:hypothetical protein [Pseudomonadota bacterium]